MSGAGKNVVRDTPPGQPNRRRVAWRVNDWPAQDRIAWADAQRVGDFDQPDGPAAKWRPKTMLTMISTYGCWLAYLHDHDLLDIKAAPAARVSPDSILAYIARLQEHLAPATVASYLGILGTMVQAMAPDAHLTWFWKIQARLQKLARTAKPARNKRARIVSSGELLALGEDLMAKAEAMAADAPLKAALLCRDGLMIALLALCPFRRLNFIAIEIDRHLLPAGDGYDLCFTAEEMKGKHSLEAPFPANLLPALARYLSVYRPFLLSQRAGRGRSRDRGLRASRLAGTRLWITQYGQAFSDDVSIAALKKHTVARFGHHVNTHLFRDCAATTLAHDDPTHVRIARDILGHASFGTTEKHYIVANSRMASARYHDLIASIRTQPKG